MDEEIAIVRIVAEKEEELDEEDMIEGQKWSVILGMLWLAHHNLEID